MSIILKTSQLDTVIANAISSFSKAIVNKILETMVLKNKQLWKYGNTPPELKDDSLKYKSWDKFIKSGGVIHDIPVYWSWIRPSYGDYRELYEEELYDNGMNEDQVDKTLENMKNTLYIIFMDLTPVYAFGVQITVEINDEPKVKKWLKTNGFSI